MSIVLKLLSSLGWKRILVAGSVLGLALVLLILNYQNESLERRLTEFRADNARLEQNLTAARELAVRTAEQNRAAIESLENTLRAARERADNVAKIKKEIYNAKPSEDGPVAPVLDRTLDRLRELQK